MVNQEGITRIEGEVRRTVPSPVIVIVTNARVIFVTPDEELGLDEGLLDYGDLTEIAVDAGRPNLVKLTTSDGVVWRCILPDADRQVLTAVKNHLRWIGNLRSRTVELEAEVEETADAIRKYADEMDWEPARAAYQRERDRLDRLIADCNVTDTVANHVIAPELTDIARTLEDAHVRVHIERARSKLELARYLVEREEYENAADSIEETRAVYRTARGQSEAVRRSDSFQFGRQRDLEEDLKRLDWELESVVAEPLRQANDATVRAEETDDLATAIEHREAALDRYDRILDLGWLDIDPGVDGDAEEITQKRTETAVSLVHLHAEIARERWNQTVYRQRAGDVRASLERLRTTVTHIERAHELADGLGPGQVDLAAELNWMPEALEGERETRGRGSRGGGWNKGGTRFGSDDATEDDQPTTADDTDSSDDDPPALDEDEIPTLDNTESSDDENGLQGSASNGDPGGDAVLSLEDAGTSRESSTGHDQLGSGENETESNGDRPEDSNEDTLQQPPEPGEEPATGTTQSVSEPPATGTDGGSTAQSGTAETDDGSRPTLWGDNEILDTDGDESLTWLERGSAETEPAARNPPSLPSVRDLTEMDARREIPPGVRGLSVAVGGTSREDGDGDTAPDAAGTGVESQ